MADPDPPDEKPEYLRVARSQLDSLEDHCETARRDLEVLQASLASDDGPTREIVVRSLEEQPRLGERCRAIRRNTFEPLERQLSKLVATDPGITEDLSPGRIDDSMRELAQHHRRLMTAIERLDGIARADRFDLGAARRTVDDTLQAVDHIESTAALLRCLLAKAAPLPVDAGASVATESGDTAPEFVVTGTVSHGDAPLEGVTVRAFDRDLDGEEPLGEATTDASGAYRIGYDESDFTSAERATADVVVRVFDRVGSQVAVSAVHYNVGPEATVDVRVPAERDVAPSEYALLRAELEPLLDGRPVASLDDAEISFLATELEVSDRSAYPADVGSLRYLANADQVANQTPVSEPVAYAITRQTGRTWNSDELAAADPETLVDHVRAAVDANVLAAEPENLEWRLRRALETIGTATRPDLDDRAQQVAIPSVVDPETGRPLSGYTVEVTDAHDADVSVEHARSVTDEGGGFGFSYLVPPAADPDETDGTGEGDDTAGSDQADGARERTFDVRVSKDGRTVGTGELTLDDGTTGTVEIRSATPGRGSATPIETLAGTTDLGLSDTGVSKAGELTFDDIRAAGGIDGTGVRVPEEDAARLDSLAELTMVASPSAAARLYEAGYDSHLAVARTPPGTFERELSETLPPAEIETIRARAVAGADLLEELLLEHRIALASEEAHTPATPAVDAESTRKREAADGAHPPNGERS